MIYIVIWKAYEEWKAANPFPTKEAAEKHIERYIAVPGKEYYTDVEIIEWEPGREIHRV